MCIRDRPISINAPPGSSGDFTWADPALVDSLNLFSGDPVFENYTLIANYSDINGCTKDIEISFVYLTEPFPFIEQLNGTETICGTSETAIFQSNYIRLNLDVVSYNLDVPTGATLVSGTDAGPYELSFDAPGTYEFGMTLSLYGGRCIGEEETFTVVVEPEPELNLACGTQAETSVSLVWDDLGLEYEILQEGSAIGTTMDTFFEVTGLAGNQQFEFTVNAADPNCGLISETVDCVTFACTDPVVDISMVPDTICWDPTSGPVLLDISITPGMGASDGDFVWDTPLVNAANEFTPADLQIENYSLDAIYTDNDGCTLTVPVEFIFVATPEIALSVSEDMICEGDQQVTLLGEFPGLNPLAIEYITDFPTGVTVVDNPSPGQYLLSFDGSGAFDLSMSVTYYGLSLIHI